MSLEVNFSNVPGYCGGLGPVWNELTAPVILWHALAGEIAVIILEGLNSTEELQDPPFPELIAYYVIIVAPTVHRIQLSGFRFNPTSVRPFSAREKVAGREKGLPESVLAWPGFSNFNNLLSGECKVLIFLRV